MNRDTPFPGATLVVDTADATWVPFPIPGATDGLTAAILNRDAALGPTMVALRMPAGARIPAHYHERAIETFITLEGEFINAGVAYPPGTFFAIAPGDVHGPHETRDGCTLAFIQTVEVDPTDFHIAE